jgi:hypothetical protein
MKEKRMPRKDFSSKIYEHLQIFPAVYVDALDPYIEEFSFILGGFSCE